MNAGSSRSDSSAQSAPTSSTDPYIARLASLKAALASTASRSLALYFSRPIRLFRPSKISGWHSLGGQSLPLLIKQNGWAVIPRHFVPPLFINALLGTVLWTTYAETSALLNAHAPSTAVAAISGCCAGAVQALAAAPAENVRLILEGGRARGSWSVAWKEVFAGAESLAPMHAHSHTRDEVRQVRNWVREVREMAGRGWQGLGFGIAKDACAFAVFFAIFDVTRHAAAHATSLSERAIDNAALTATQQGKVRMSGIVHSTTIVTGGLIAGLAHEFVSRPFDVSRRSLHGYAPTQRIPSSICKVLAEKVQNDGVRVFFRDPMRSLGSVQGWVRILGRVGPWGVGFLVWETFGPGVSGRA